MLKKKFDVQTAELEATKSDVQRLDMALKLQEAKLTHSPAPSSSPTPAQPARKPRPATEINTVTLSDSKDVAIGGAVRFFSFEPHPASSQQRSPVHPPSSIRRSHQRSAQSILDTLDRFDAIELSRPQAVRATPPRTGRSVMAHSALTTPAQHQPTCYGFT